MTRCNPLKDKLAAGQPTTIIAPYATSAGLVELLGHFGFDGVFLDCEHGPASWEEVEHMIRAAERRRLQLGRARPGHDAATITRALDRGAGGIQVPHVNTAEPKRRRSSSMRSTRRSATAGGAAGAALTAWTASSTRGRPTPQTLVAIMLEETEALNNLDDILRVDNVDVFFVAPGDLAQSMGCPGQTNHPSVQTAIDDALRQIKRSGRISGTLTTPGTLDHYLDLGVLFLYVGLQSLLEPASHEFIARGYTRPLSRSA